FFQYSAEEAACADPRNDHCHQVRTITQQSRLNALLERGQFQRARPNDRGSRKRPAAFVARGVLSPTRAWTSAQSVRGARLVRGGSIMQNILRAILLIAMLNFLTFWYGALILGGDAGNGKKDGGRFFVGEHGKYTEVTEGVYRY